MIETITLKRKNYSKPIVDQNLHVFILSNSYKRAGILCKELISNLYSFEFILISV